MLNTKKKLMEQAYGPDAFNDYAEGRCLSCKEPALQNCYSDAGRREVQISGICEKCFDNLFSDED